VFSVEPLWNITLFRELSLGRQGETVRRFRSQKVASLLAFLAYYRGRAYTREFLCEMLWPEEDPLTARNRLRVTLASLRRQMEPPGVPFGAVIETVGNSGIRLRAEAVTTDVAAFEAALKKGDSAEAARIYGGGPLLPGQYEEWILGEQERLTALLEGAGEGAVVRESPSALPSENTSPEEKPAASPRAAVSTPLYLTRFVGRETELERLRELLADESVRLIILTGPGGNGKTRLATEAVRNDTTLRAFVPLADLWEAGRLGEALRHSLRLPAGTSQEPLAQVADYLNECGRARLVLDNLEQIAQGAAPLIAELLARVPGLSLLVTSRRRLDLPGERELPIAPLPLPTSDSPELVAAAPSVRLFLDRAQGVRPDFQITPRTATEVADLCRLLEGVPLALELAAARAGTLTPGQMRQRLAEGGHLPDAGAQGPKEDRHRSLGAVIEWSYALLPPELRRLFLTLSVFRGGWDLEAAEAIAEGGQVLDGLSRLRGHSLVTPRGERFSLLETLRRWADEQLSEAERLALEERHAAYFLKRGEECVDHTGKPEEAYWLDRLEADQPNLRAAFDASVRVQDTETALRLSLVLHAWGRARGSIADALSILNRAIAVPVQGEASISRARVLVAGAAITQLIRGPGGAVPLLEEALQIARAVGERPLTARILRSIADGALLQRDAETALPLYLEALALQNEIGDERGASQTKNSLAFVYLDYKDDAQEARRLIQEAGDYFRGVRDIRMLSYNLFNLGEIDYNAGEYDQAANHYQESLTIARETNDEWHRLYCLIGMARVSGGQGKDTERRTYTQEALPLALQMGDPPLLAEALLERAENAFAARDARLFTLLLAAAEASWERGGEVRKKNDQKRFEANVAAARAALAPRSFEAAWKKGETMDPGEVVALALK
jgi:predicted ATPase/DNA-binding winged helix-turn-helix (wHTH) protein